MTCQNIMILQLLKTITVLNVLVMGLFTSIANEIHAAEKSFDQIKKEASEAWRNYLHSLEHYSGIVTIKSDSSDGFSWEETKSFDCSYPYALFSNVTKDNIHSLRVYNEKYHFSIQRANKNESFTVVDIEKLTQEPVSEWKYPKSNNLAGDAISNTLASGLQLYPFWLPTLWNSEHFIITDIKCFNENDFEIVRVTFHIDLNKSEGISIKEGTLDLLPKTQWLILRANYTLFTNEQVDLTNKYSHEFQQPLLIEQTRTGKSKNISFNTILKVSNIQHEKKVEFSKFTLSHYGLPEPDFGDRRANRIRYVIMIGGLILIGIGAWRMVQKRRENA